jgi:hypothetical protein
MRFPVSGRVRWLALVVVVLGLVGGGLAYANIPDSGGVIHGCYSPNGANAPNGAQLNIINSDSASCSKGQKEITWNQTGPQGEAGEAVAFAGVGLFGAVNPATSKNVVSANVTHPADGLYCFGDLGFQPRSVVVTPISGIDVTGREPTNIDTIATAAIAFPPDTFPAGCALTDTVRVRTVAASSPGTLTNRPFMIWFED